MRGGSREQRGMDTLKEIMSEKIEGKRNEGKGGREVGWEGKREEGGRATYSPPNYLSSQITEAVCK